MSQPPMIPRTDLAALLASALGQEKSEELVAEAARELGLSGEALTADDARAALQKLAAVGGLVGVVARFAISRGDVDQLVARVQARAAAEPAPPPRPAAVDLTPLLAPALGAEKARDATSVAATRLGYDPSRLSRDEALAVLEELARAEGIVGVVARFAKARFLLMA